MKCKLCGIKTKKLAKSHIFPIGFFKNISTKGLANTFTAGGEKGRKLQKAIWDKNILCHECEGKIMSPLDDYGIKIFRDRIGSFEVAIPEKPLDKIIIYKNIDEKKLRAFIASILWRVSISEQLEIKKLSIGEKYEERISTDLKSDISTFDYIDVFTLFLSNKIHMGFMLPFKQKINPINIQRDCNSVNGWVVEFPNIRMSVSLDKREHPNRTYYNLSTELTKKSKNILASSSLLSKEHGYRFMCLETEKNDNVIALMGRAFNLLNIKKGKR